MCNCRNSTFVLITALITVYFSNIIVAFRLFALFALTNLRLYRRLPLFPKNYGNALFSGALFLGFASLMSLTAQQESLFSISQLLPFVKYFFQLFSKVFYSLIYPAARDSLIILPHLFHLVKGFFELFSKKFMRPKIGRIKLYFLYIIRPP